MRLWNPFRPATPATPAPTAPEPPKRLTVTPRLRGFNPAHWRDQLTRYSTKYDPAQIELTVQGLIAQGNSAAADEEHAYNEAEGRRIEATAECDAELTKLEGELGAATGTLNALSEAQFGHDSKVKAHLRSAQLRECAEPISPQAIDELIETSIEERNPPPLAEMLKRKNGFGLNAVKLFLLVIAGVFVGLTGGQIFHLLSLRDLRDWDLKPTVILAFAAGQAFCFGITWCCTELTRVIFRTQRGAKKEDRDMTGGENGIVAVAIAIMIALIIVELSVEAFGLRGLFSEWAAMMQRRAVKVEQIPMALFYCFGAIVSFPLIILTIFGTLRAIGEETELAEKNAAATQAENNRRRTNQTEVVRLRSNLEVKAAKAAAEIAINHRTQRLNPAQEKVMKLADRIKDLQQPIYIDDELVETIRTKQAEIGRIEQELEATLAIDDFAPPAAPGGGSPAVAAWLSSTP